MNEVAIYKLDKGTDWWCWLCPRHLAKRKRSGFEVKERREPPHALTCDDCVEGAILSANRVAGSAA